MKQNLEAELQKLKGLYEREFEQMKAEIEEISLQRNKFALENFNLDIKFKDLSIKFEELKRDNEELEVELRDKKSQLNRTEFELENAKLEIDKPLRENKQLKKDLEDLLDKLNELQTISDSEIAYRQKLEKKLKEINDSSVFKDKLSQQELESLKLQLNSVQGDYEELNQKLENVLSREKTLEAENNALKAQLTAAKQTCSNLQNKVQTLEQIRKTLEGKLDRSSFDSSNIMTKAKPYEISDESLLSRQPMLKINRVSSASIAGVVDGSENKPTQSKVSFEDNPNQPTKLVPTVEAPNLSSKSNSDYIPTSASSICRKPIQTSAQVRFKSNDTIDRNHHNYHHFHHEPSDSNRGANFMVHSSGVSSPLFSSSSIGRQEETSSNQLPEKLAKSMFKDDLSRKSTASTSSRDFTKELFSQLEKKIFSSVVPSSTTSTAAAVSAAAAGFENGLTKVRKDTNLNSSLSSIDNHTVTEASYIGNVKIHEVNKNGYYIRLLNVSSTQEEDLSNYSIQQMVSTMPVAVYRIPASIKLCPGKTLTVWASTDEVEQVPPHTFVWSEQNRWGTGPECTTILAKPNGQAVSWTTGCHKYGNIALKDYDDLVPVYTHKRSGKTTSFLERNKFIPQKVYTPTKHPHGMSSLKTNGDVPGDVTPSSTNSAAITKGSQQFSTGPIQRNLTHQRPRSSTNSSMSMRTTTSLGHYAIRPDPTSKESNSYFQKPNTDD